jgi:hypothetical protein
MDMMRHLWTGFFVHKRLEGSLKDLNMLKRCKCAEEDARKL